MQILKIMTFVAICLTSFAASGAAQSTVDAASRDSVTKSTTAVRPLTVNIYSTEYDVSTNVENSGFAGKSILGNALIMTTKTFGSKLAQFVRSGEVTVVRKDVLSVTDGATGEISFGIEIPVIKPGDANSENVIETINAGYLFKASPTVVRTANNPTPVSVSLAFEISDNEVDKPLQYENDIPAIIKREIKADETFYPGNTRIYGGFLSKDGSTRRYFAVCVEIVDYSLLTAPGEKK